MLIPHTFEVRQSDYKYVVHFPLYSLSRNWVEMTNLNIERVSLKTPTPFDNFSFYRTINNKTLSLNLIIVAIDSLLMFLKLGLIFCMQFLLLEQMEEKNNNYDIMIILEIESNSQLFLIDRSKVWPISFQEAWFG